MLTSKPVKINDGQVHTEFTLKEGESAYFILSEADADPLQEPELYAGKD